MKKISRQTASKFIEAELISGLELKKLHALGNTPIFAIFGRPLPSALQQVKIASPKNPASMDAGLNALSWMVDHLDEILKTESEDLDLSAEIRFAMKEAIYPIMGLTSTDDLRLVQAGSRIFVFNIHMVENFRKTDKGYSWNWVK